MYQVLARKWRPKNFHELVGQTHVTQALTYALDHNQLHHAYLFTGTRGVGKTTIARIFAKSLNCQKNHVSSNPCGECDHCREIDQGSFPDLIEVDAASRTGVDDTRELLNNVPYAPVKGAYKVYLIDEVHMFSASSFNALLKTLEEPPPHVKFILATTDPQKLPATILSRCLQFHLKNMSEQQIVEHLSHILQTEQADFDIEALQLLAQAASGSMRDSLSLLDQALAYGQGNVRTHDVATLLGAIPEPQLLHMLQLLADGKAVELRNILASLDTYAPDYAALLLRFLQQLQKITIASLGAERYTGEISADLHLLAQRLPVELVQLWYQIGNETWQNLPYQPDARMALEMCLLRMIALQPLLPDSDPMQAKLIQEAAPAPTDNVANFISSPSSHQEQLTSDAPLESESTTSQHSAFSEKSASFLGNESTKIVTNATSSDHDALVPFSSAEQAANVSEENGTKNTYDVVEPLPHSAESNHEKPNGSDTLQQQDDHVNLSHTAEQDEEPPPWVSEIIPDDAVPVTQDMTEKESELETSPPSSVQKQDKIDNPIFTSEQNNQTEKKHELLTSMFNNPERWSTFLSGLDLQEYPLLLLENSVPAAWHPPLLSLHTAPSGMVFDQAQNRIQAAAAIGSKMGLACEIEILPVDAIRTPIDYRRQKNAEEQQRAERDFLTHPQVEAAKSVFGADLQVDNIQPLNTQE
ncbi:MAG: DNA polymerase III subunit gamma/tau [Cardiobacteriaceae bacterium]|nr:DNA polymerase III subunit gamma/tau [Cardiobacteriaceae bacterium]